MIRTNLIFIDGLPGSGKSITAQILCLHLQRLGHQTRWFFEHQSSHPVYKYDDPEKMFETTLASEEIREQAMENWETLATELRGTSKVTILESTFFQTTIGWLQLMDVERAEIISFASRISQLTDVLNPALIYFYQDDVAKALEKTSERRGEWFENFLVSRIGRTPYGQRTSITNLDGVIRFYEQVRSITDELYSGLTLHKVAIETSAGDWPEYHRQISEFLSIPTIQPVFRPPMSCDGLVGRYREINSGNEVGIGCDSDGLYFDEPGRPRLFHNEGSTFSIEGMCIAFSFKQHENGAATEIESSGDVPGASGRWLRI
jgi:hypothetical protein